jgi:hypothetical protein
VDALTNFRPSAPRSDRFGRGDASKRILSVFESLFAEKRKKG